VKPRASVVLIAAALITFAIALLHVFIIGIGAPAYLYFGAANMAQLAAQSSWIPALVTSFATMVLVLFGLYALAGAGVVSSLPFAQVGVILIGVLFTLRGLVIVLDVVRLTQGASYPLRQTVFSAVSLGLGLLYLAGAVGRQRQFMDSAREAG
jgi:hypothetical protein